MKKLKSAEEYLIGCEHDGSFVPVNEIIRLIKRAQIDAIQATVENCTEEAECTSIDMNGFIV